MIPRLSHLISLPHPLRPLHPMELRPITYPGWLRFLAGSLTDDRERMAGFRQKMTKWTYKSQMIYSLVAGLGIAAMICYRGATREHDPSKMKLPSEVRVMMYVLVVLALPMFTVLHATYIWRVGFEDRDRTAPTPFERVARAGNISFFGYLIGELADQAGWLTRGFYQPFRFGWLFALFQAVLWPVMDRLVRWKTATSSAV